MLKSLLPKHLTIRVMFQPEFGDKQHLIYRKDEDFSLILQKENDIVFLLGKYLPFSETV